MSGWFEDPYGRRRLTVARVAVGLSKRVQWIAFSISAWVVNRVSRRSVIDAGGSTVVAVGTHGKRSRTAYRTIETLARGTTKPSRLLVYHDLAPGDRVPRTLQRLQRRGLELVQEIDGLGPHNKYYGYVCSLDRHEQPLATVDDDAFYHRTWLADLERTYAAHHGEYVVCEAARTVALSDDGFEPFESWAFCGSSAPSRLTFHEGVWGVIYPPAHLDALRDAGDGFVDTCLLADDVWLNLVGLRAGILTVQRRSTPTHHVPRFVAQRDGLMHSNVLEGGNFKQLTDAYQPEDLALLRSERNCDDGR